MNFNEREFSATLRESNQKAFLKMVADYEAQVAPAMRSQGYKRINKVQRTVTFSFGEMTFARSRWKKGNITRIPVDEKLGLEKHQRYSKEMIYQIAVLATYVPYRKVGDIFELLTQAVVSKDTVKKTIKYATDLIKEKEEYRYYQEQAAPKKVKAKFIYLEGDGVLVKAKTHQKDKQNIELSHFVIHIGSQRIENQRSMLQNKKEFVSISHDKAREQVKDYLYNHFEINEETILVCNSDGGKGYGVHAFKTLGKNLGFKKIEYFWDSYHLNEKIKQFFRAYPDDLHRLAFKAIQTHNKNDLNTVFDTLESLIETEEELNECLYMRQKLLTNFSQTKPAKLRGFSHDGIGIMESQHRKITYRMKNRGMYWSVDGADTMSQLIILREENKLRGLFFGDWKKEFEKILETIEQRHHAKEKTNTYHRLPEGHLKTTRLSKRVSALKK